MFWGSPPAVASASGNGKCFVRNLTTKAKALGDALDATPTVYVKSSTACAFDIKADGAASTPTSGAPCTTALKKYDYFNYALEKWGDAYANLIDAEATYRVADWYYQKISLMYGKVYPDVLDNTPPSAESTTA